MSPTLKTQPNASVLVFTNTDAWNAVYTEWQTHKNSTWGNEDLTADLVWARLVTTAGRAKRVGWSGPAKKEQGLAWHQGAWPGASQPLGLHGDFVKRPDRITTAYVVAELMTSSSRDRLGLALQLLCAPAIPVAVELASPPGMEGLTV